MSAMIVQTYKGYDLRLTDDRGGKAGRGRGVTRSVQVTIAADSGYLLKANFQFNIGSDSGYDKAKRRALSWIDRNPLKGGAV